MHNCMGGEWKFKLQELVVEVNRWIKWNFNQEFNFLITCMWCYKIDMYVTCRFFWDIALAT